MPRRARDNAFHQRELDRRVQDIRATFEEIAHRVRYEDRVKQNAFCRRLGLSQAAFARQIGLDVRAVRASERRAERPANAVIRAFLEKQRDEGAADGRRLTIESALGAAFQRYERSDRNPLHVWEAVWMCTHPEGVPVPLPRWGADYLYEVAERLLAMPAELAQTKRRDPHQADTAIRVSGALALTKQGWSAFDKFNGDAAKIDRKLKFDESQFEGGSFHSSLAAASQYGTRISAEGAKKAVQHGKRLLGHNPQASRSRVKH